jgi:hypothetical protein
LPNMSNCHFRFHERVYSTEDVADRLVPASMRRVTTPACIAVFMISPVLNPVNPEKQSV